MKKTKINQEFKDRYKNYRKEVRDHMNIILENYDIEEGFLLNLDMIAINLNLMYQAIDSLKNDGFVQKDFRDRTHKNYAIQQLNSSQQTIIKLLNNFPSNSLIKAKIKKLSQLDDNSSPLDEFFEQ